MQVCLSCECGKQIPVSEGAAGTSLSCDCGRTIRVPSLGELRRRVAGGNMPYVPTQRPPPVPVAVKAFLNICGGSVFLLGAVLFIGNVTGVFPTVPMAGYILMAIGGAIFGAGALQENTESQLDVAFHEQVETRLRDFRQWSTPRSFSGCRLAQFRQHDLVGVREIPLIEAGHHIEALMQQGFQVDWAEHQGQLYLRAWEVGGPEPEWAKAFGEQGR
jgi:hypothetical protein